MNPSRSRRSAASASASRPAVSWPAMRYWPLLGRSRQPRMFIKVDLPEPDAPTIAIISPASILRSMSFSATKTPSPEGYSRRTPANSSSALTVQVPRLKALGSPLTHSRCESFAITSSGTSGRKLGFLRFQSRGISQHDRVACLQALEDLNHGAVVETHLDPTRLDIVF